MNDIETKIYIWANAAAYSSKKWRSESASFIAAEKSNIIIFNHHLKEYRKNFKCHTSVLRYFIDKSQDMRPGSSRITTHITHNLYVI